MHSRLPIRDVVVQLCNLLVRSQLGYFYNAAVEENECTGKGAEDIHQDTARRDQIGWICFPLSRGG